VSSREKARDSTNSRVSLIKSTVTRESEANYSPQTQDLASLETAETQSAPATASIRVTRVATVYSAEVASKRANPVFGAENKTLSKDVWASQSLRHLHNLVAKPIGLVG
jgi:hypothetical protein